MSPQIVGLIAFALLIVLMFVRVPIILSFLISGMVGYTLIDGFNVMANTVSFVAFKAVYSFGYSVAPLFILMGNLVAYSGFAEDAYIALRNWLGRLPGGLIHATILANVVFAAMSGLSLAAAATFAKISVPEMKRAGYDVRLASGTVAGCGPLASLIPPSLLMVLFSILTEAPLGKLLIAGIFPGLMCAVIFIVLIAAIALWKPSLAPRAAGASWKERFQSLTTLWPMIIIIVIILGSIYTGVATPTEAGAFGAFGALVVGVAMRRLGWKAFYNSLFDAALVSGMIFAIIVSAKFFSQMIVISGLPNMIVGMMVGHVPMILMMIELIVIYLILGCFMDPPSMLFVTISSIAPLFVAFNVDIVWAGIILVIILEVGILTPPYGMGLFVVRAAVPKECEVSFGGISLGILPYVFGYIVAIALILAFPTIALWLPGKMA